MFWLGFLVGAGLVFVTGALLCAFVLAGRVDDEQGMG